MILEEHFADLYNYRIKSSDSADEDAGDDAESRCSTADSFFAALFADRPEFVKDSFFDQDLVTTFFNTAERADDSRVLGRLHSWMDELLSKYNDGSSSATREASTPTELTAKLQPFLAAVDADETGVRVTSLWPIIERIE